MDMQKKLDGTFNCALCDLPRKQLDVYTLCSGHMSIWYSLAEKRNNDQFREMNEKIGENLESKGPTTKEEYERLDRLRKGVEKL